MEFSNSENIALIGSGNLGWHLANVLQKAGHQISFIYSRNEITARELAANFAGLQVTSSLDFSSKNISSIILTVPDAAIGEITANLKLPDKAVLIHTSGSFPLNKFKLPGFSTGVLYPLQTFTRKRIIDLAEVPVFIEASDDETISKIWKLAGSISNLVYEVKSEQRQKIHMAAVFSSNFINHLINISGNLLKNEGLDINILKPLVFETIAKSFEIGPSKAQTGPAIRGDQETIENHLKNLDYEPIFQQIYLMISKNINQLK